MREKLFLLLVLFTVLLSSCKNNKTVEYKDMKLTSDWFVHQSDSVTKSGEIISSSQQSVVSWYKANVPSTLMGVLIENGLYKNIFVGENYKNIDSSQFKTSWWYRKEFKLSHINENEHIFINFDGISYSANIWLNGKLIAGRDSIFGTFRRHSIDITPYVLLENVLAIEVFQAQKGDPNIGFADWNPRPIDESIGILREISLSITGHVKVEKTYVESKINMATKDEAWLTINTEVENLSDKKITGELVGKIDSERFSYPIVLYPREKKKIRLTSDDIQMLHIKKPRLWWCNNMGAPELYDLNLSFRANNTILDKDCVTFGIREIESYFTKNGERGFKLNGENVLLKGAGWTDRIFLDDTSDKNEIQIKYVKEMNLNMIRFENFWGNSSSIYDLCDKYGILAIIGWSCHWEWEAYYEKPCSEEFGCILSEEEMNLISKSFEDQVLWLRNHPSIIAWMPGSDMLPKPELEEKYLSFLETADNRPYIGAAKKRESSISGSTGTKMEGPYEYVGPNYWYIDSLRGGAYGFNTETGIGAQLPVIESIKRFIPEDELWPINSSWSYHCTSSSTAMNNLNMLTSVINNKYGIAKDLEDYLLKADLVNYDATRAMYEAFRVNSSKATGVVHWMLNSAWPSLYWQLYDYYLVPTAAYYSAKKGNAPTQLIYNYGTNSIFAVNEFLSDMKACKALIKVYDFNSQLLTEKEISIDIYKNSSKEVFKLKPLDENIFLSTELYDSNGVLISDNFYCLSYKNDEYLWDKSTWIHTPMKSYADFKSLSCLNVIELDTDISVREENDDLIYDINVINLSDQVAFFVLLKLKDKDGEMLIPAYWSDNYISLLPGMTKNIKLRLNKSLINNDKKVIKISGWNCKSIEVFV